MKSTGNDWVLIYRQSKQCQRAAWPRHKQSCKAASKMSNPRQEASESLRAFTDKHHKVLSGCAKRALRLDVDLERAFDNVFIISLKRRPGATQTRNAWIVREAFAAPFEYLAPILPEESSASVLKTNLRAARERELLECPSYTGILMTFLIDYDTGASYHMTYTFNPALFIPNASPWDVMLRACINDGRRAPLGW